MPGQNLAASKTASPASEEAVVPEQATPISREPVADISVKRPATEVVTPVSVKNDPQQPVENSVQTGQAGDTSGPQENRLVRSVSNGSHQPVALTGQETVAKSVEPGNRPVQALANGVAAKIDAVGAGTSGDTSGNPGHSLSQETPQQPQVPVSAVHQQAAFSSAEALTQATGVANQTEQSKVEQGHIVNQVKEQLSTHEVKQGTDQISIRISPENLGDIQVNLRMDNQRLKVEIVAQNQTVRDALMQNSDSLKDSLARQNITMDSFNVTTGGNSGFGQDTSNAWKQLAQQRQATPWMPSGYHTAGQQEVLRNMPVYLAGQEHAMVDLHF
jgi:flagellar hook-length control protein FliK